jgi:hypothetical protein
MGSVAGGCKGENVLTNRGEKIMAAKKKAAKKATKKKH